MAAVEARTVEGAAVEYPYSEVSKGYACSQVVALEPDHAEDKYCYSTLTKEPPHIRLVTLKPGSWSDGIECSLNVVALDAKPSYETISYVWGDPRVKKPIRLDGCHFTVTENLWLAMRRLRRPSEPRVMWIDAVSINQTDNDEKSYQVGMMGEIYKGCQKCTVWLGEDPENAQADGQSKTGALALELFRMFAEGKHLWEMACFEAGTLLTTSGKYKDHIKAGRRIFELPWWQRVWVIQELTLPHSVEFIYASEQFPYSMMLKMTEELTEHCEKCCRVEALSLAGDSAFEVLLLAETQVGPMMSARKTLTKHGDLNLFQLRKQFYSSQATEKRDLFYGLLSLVTKWSSNRPLQPNYDISLREAVTDAAFVCVLEGGMDFLIGDRARQMSDGMFDAADLKKMPDLPSWIPDTCFYQFPVRLAAAEGSRLCKYSYFKASGEHKQESSELGIGKDGVLFAQTLAVDKIAQVGPVCEVSEYNIGKAMIASREWMRMAGVEFWGWPSEMPPEGSPLNNFWRMMLYDLVMKSTTGDSYRKLTTDDYTEHQELWRRLSPFVSPWFSWIFELAPMVISFLSKLPNPFGNPIGNPELLVTWVAKSPETLLHLLVCIWDRRMYITEGNVIGLAPAGTEVGDEVHIVLGATAPFIFRRTEDTIDDKLGSGTDPRPSYKIIGNCFQLNIMNGEALEKGGAERIKTVAIH